MAQPVEHALVVRVGDDVLQEVRPVVHGVLTKHVDGVLQRLDQVFPGHVKRTHAANVPMQCGAAGDMDQTGRASYASETVDSWTPAERSCRNARDSLRSGRIGASTLEKGRPHALA